VSTDYGRDAASQTMMQIRKKAGWLMGTRFSGSVCQSRYQLTRLPGQQAIGDPH